MEKPTFRLYNTLTQSLEPFEPITPGQVRLYACGLTPYSKAHAGHARAGAAFDVLIRYLRARGYEVTFVRNFTDVDDKILARAKELGEDPLAFSARMTELNGEELAAVGCAVPDFEPKVSEHIPEIVALVQTLIDKGHAYAAKTPVGTDVYFAVRSFPAYGKLSHRKLDDLLSGARVEVSEIKRDPLDFALWKGCTDETWGWDSPWGKGRPGWHIECSAMAMKYLGPHMDIHCGGADLIFPHHENEIAQSEAAYGPELARHWMHNGLLTIDSEKMSKSLGNFVTIEDVLERNDPEGFRYFILGTHYRGPLNFDVDKREDDGRVVFPGVDEAERRVEYVYGTRQAALEAAGGADAAAAGPFPGLATQAAIIDGAPEKVLAALDKDLNTPQALGVLAELAKAANEVAVQVGKLRKDPKAQGQARVLAARAARSVTESCAVLGLLQASYGDFTARSQARRMRLRGVEASAVEARIAARNEARAGKDFALSDRIRDELAAQGIEILDGPAGSSWKIGV